MTRILIIEDDADIAHSLKYRLQHEGGYVVDVAADGERGLQAANRNRPDLVLLDLNLPGVSGIDVCQQLRSTAATADLPIIMLTARVDEADRVHGLEIGADDYVTKPFSVKEVLARVRALLRRSAMSSDAPRVFEIGPIRLDEASRRVRVDGKEVEMTRKEFDLLAALLHQRGRVLSRDVLLDRVWGYDDPGATRTVDVHVRQLRRKLGEAAAAYIETVVGVGYRFRGED